MDLFSHLDQLTENQFGERYFYSVNRDTFNSLGSEGFYSVHFGKNFFEPAHLYVFVGTDSGLLVRYIQRYALFEDSRYVFVELDEYLPRIRELIGPDPLDPKVAVVSLGELEEQIKAFGVEEYVYVRKLFVVEAVCTADAFVPDYRRLLASVRQAMELVSWEIKAALGNEDFLRTQMENLAENRRPATFLMDLFPGKNAVVLGGGPSLDELLPWVARHRDNLAVLAVSRISRRLRQVGVVPDLVFSIDPQYLSFVVSREMLYFADESVFINFYHVAPPLLGQWRGRSASLGPRLPWPSPLNVPTIACEGPTVTHLALRAAVEMGCTEIILGGVDLCFTPDGYTHARGTRERESGPNLASTHVRVETNGGWSAETTTAYAHGIEAIGNLAALAKVRGGRVVNPFPGAARMPNVAFEPLEKLTPVPCERPLRECLAEVLPLERPEERSRHYRLCLEEIAGARKGIRQVERLATEALEANAGLFGRGGRKPDFRCKGRMDAVEARLNGELHDNARLVKQFSAWRFLEIVSPYRQEWSDEEVERVGRVYYSAYRDGARALLSILDETEERLNSRLDEEKKRPDIVRLARQWEKDRQPGRALLWRARRPDLAGKLTPGEEGCLDRFNATFERLMQEGNCPEMDRYFEGKAALEGIRAEITLLFRGGDREGLEKLVGGLPRYGHPNAIPLANLARGHLAELKGEKDNALSEYEPLVSQTDPILVEEALKRIAVILLDRENLEEALLALECLAELSPLYVPKYAELLWIVGERERALDLCAEHMGRFPDDLGCMLRLGRWYAEMNSPEGVRLATDYILAREPDNRAAAALLRSVHLPFKEASC